MLTRFETCISLVEAAQGWEARSRAARGIGALENEVDEIRQTHLEARVPLDQLTALSVVSWRFTLEGLNHWQQAFRCTHLDKLDEAFDCALEAMRTLRAVQKWSDQATALLVVADLALESEPVGA